MTKPGAPWWEAPLAYWSAAWGWTFVVSDAAREQRSDTFRRDGERVFIRLDEDHIAVLTGPNLTDAACEALAWTIRLAQHAGHRSWREQAVLRLAELAALSDEDLSTAWQTAGRVTVESSQQPSRPGYFVWVHFASEGRDGGISPEMKTSIQEIVRAFDPQSLLGWPAVGAGNPSLLLFCQTPVRLDADPEGTVVGQSREARERAWLQKRLGELANMFAEDALVLTKMAVGCRIRDGREQGVGLVSAVATWRSRWLFKHTEPTLVWGHYPWVTLLQSLRHSDVERFLQSAASRSPDSELRLSDEWVETLDGLVAANLNVSEAARLLYLHRNTLMNRIERMRQQTGYDIRIFRDAAVLWLVHLVQKKKP